MRIASPALVVAALACLPPFTAGAASGEDLGPGMVNPGYHGQPEWFKQSFLDLREDVAEAGESGKRVLLYFYQDGCPYCARLLRESFADRDIATKTREAFDVIAINMWGDREVTGLDGQPATEKAFAAALGVQFTPTLLFLDEEGRVVLRVNGYFPPHKLETALDYAAGGHEKEGPFSAFYAEAAPEAASGQLHAVGGALDKPLRLADNRKESGRPLLVLFEQPRCAPCDELHEDVLARRPVAVSLTNLDVAQVDIGSAQRLQTPGGRELSAGDWARELGIRYTPSLVFFDAGGAEVFRAEAYLKAFHIHGALDYVATGAYRRQPSFQRFLQARTAALEAMGQEVELME